MSKVSADSKEQPEAEGTEGATRQEHHGEGRPEEVDEHVEGSQDAPYWPGRSYYSKEDYNAGPSHDRHHIRHVLLQIQVFPEHQGTVDGQITVDSYLEAGGDQSDLEEELVDLGVLPQLLEEVGLVETEE